MTVTPYERHLQAAAGFLELGLPQEANAELESIEAELRSLPPVVALRVQVYEALQAWELMAVCAKQMCVTHPQEPQGYVSLAYATRRAESLERALGILLDAQQLFPQEATILYNLACYEAQLGHLDLARGWLQDAIRLAPESRQMAQKTRTWCRCVRRGEAV